MRISSQTLIFYLLKYSFKPGLYIVVVHRRYKTNTITSFYIVVISCNCCKPSIADDRRRITTKCKPGFTMQTQCMLVIFIPKAQQNNRWHIVQTVYGLVSNDLPYRLND